MPKYTAESLLLIRRRLKKDQAEFAKMLGVTRSFVSRLEHGRFEISQAVADRLAEIEATHGTNVLSHVQAADEAQSPDAASGPSPTREQMEHRFKAYLDLAEKVPGGLGYAWGQICNHLTDEPLLRMKFKQLTDQGRALRSAGPGAADRSPA